MYRWIVGALPISLWASWAAWRGPPPPTQHVNPTPLERTSSSEEKRSALESAAKVAQAIERSRKARGTVILITQLEALDEKGVPFLDFPIPDNPIMPGIASVAEQCPAHGHISQMDWVYCPSSGAFLPVVDGQSVNGNE